MTKPKAIFVSVAEARQLLGVGRTSVYALLADKRLEGVKLGRRRLIRADSIEALAARLTGEGQ